MVSSVLNADLRKWEGHDAHADRRRRWARTRATPLMDLVIADKGQTACIIAIMTEEDVRTALRHPLVSIDTDSGAKAEDGPLAESQVAPARLGHVRRASSASTSARRSC